MNKLSSIVRRKLTLLVGVGLPCMAAAPAAHAADSIYWANFSGTTVSSAKLDGSGGGDLSTTIKPERS